MSAQPLLKLERASKAFGNVQALKAVDFELEAGEVHALLGENGAGKSTLIKAMTGALPLDAGHIVLGGLSIRPESPAEAQRLGISAVYQEVNLLPNLSVAHNLYLGREPKRHGCIRWRQLNADARRLIGRFNLEVDVRQPLSSFSIAVQQLVAIARGVDLSARVLVLDEPTASLDADEAALLFELIDELKQSGVGIVFVSHFLDQVYAISDRISVLRNGERVGTFETASLPRSELVLHMLGRELKSLEESPTDRARASSGPPVCEIRELAAANGLRSASFIARSGEALGLAGLLGSGRTELCEALFGLAARTAGSVQVDGQEQRFGSPREAIQAGLALCPEDRKTAGIIGGLTVRENIVLAKQAQAGWWRRLRMSEQQRLTEQAIAELKIVCRNAETPAATLSGGNQQKLILARWLCTEPRLLLLDEPTRGIDIGAHAEIIRLIRRLRDAGMTVVVASSEVEELIAFSDKVLVMRDRAAVALLERDDISEERIVAAIAESA